MNARYTILRVHVAREVSQIPPSTNATATTTRCALRARDALQRWVRHPSNTLCLIFRSDRIEDFSSIWLDSGTLTANSAKLSDERVHVAREVSQIPLSTTTATATSQNVNTFGPIYSRCLQSNLHKFASCFEMSAYSQCCACKLRDKSSTCTLTSA